MRMVDVGGKARTHRVAMASGAVRMSAATLSAILDGRIAKGDVLAAARLAGIMGVKRTPDLVPLCHPISISRVEVELAPDPHGLRVTARVENRDRTGVEMEALTAAAVSALSLYDTAKAFDRAAEIGGLHLVTKSGGKSGPFVRSAPRA